MSQSGINVTQVFFSHFFGKSTRIVIGAIEQVMFEELLKRIFVLVRSTHIGKSNLVPIPWTLKKGNPLILAVSPG
jgi:hypothetical protein